MLVQQHHKPVVRKRTITRPDGHRVVVTVRQPLSYDRWVGSYLPEGAWCRAYVATTHCTTADEAMDVAIAAAMTGERL